DNLKPEDFPASMGIQTDMTNRALRAEETWGADRSITAEEFRVYKYDLQYSDGTHMAKLIDQILQADAGDDADLAEAQRILAGWDRVANQESRGAALGVLMAEPVVRAGLAGREAPAALDTLRDAIGTLKTHHGRLDPAWGEVNRLRRGSVDLPVDGGPDTLRAIYGALQDDGTLTARGGDTLIMFVEWDRAGRLKSESVHQFGTATRDESSPHYADQAPLFAAMQTKPVRFEEEDLADHVVESYRPGAR
ncbi:MAG: penicillin acylase family protein, partial [Parvibaculum sp.]|nr:penicillin acylase family protein [Parvibaculum sp.]